MKFAKSALVVGVLQLALAAGAYAQSDFDAIKAAGVIKIGTEGTYAPFTYHDASGKLTGFDVEIAQEVANRLGVKAEFIESKWDGLIAGVDAKRYDLAVNEITITPERQAKYDFSDPYIASKVALIVRSDNDSIHTFADIKGKKTAHALSSNYAKLAQSYGAELVGAEGFSQEIDLIASRRVDATINDSLSFLDFKKHKPDAPLKIAATEKDAQLQGILLRKGNPDLVQAINKALADAKADGTYLKISNKYFGTDVSH